MYKKLKKIRSTSAKAYRDAVESGLLSNRRKEVFEVLYLYGTQSSTQVNMHIKGYSRNAAGKNTGARISELVSMGVVEEVGEVICKITKKTVITYDVTGNKPTPFKRPKTKTEIIAKHKILLNAIQTSKHTGKRLLTNINSMKIELGL